jgi:hypothetical protein
MYISVVGKPNFSATRLWIPSPIGFTFSRWFYDSKEFKFVVFENVSLLERIGGRVFSKTSLRSIVIPKSIHLLELNQDRNCHELKSKHSQERDYLRFGFLHQLKY